ncbi:BgTH12-01848 [Blumeria graminis f. sp. triticale]|uniref:Bgt-10 n=3 Tax=Blumeria graminis TaxID=34373 RepID=A0A9X9MFE7_BLUGR|nr:BgTH12-01848 [Blumeria graminis f. sp. triticale]VDB84149.1 Bgt-10 [Blumeria graminis f. sp. tritici]
MLSPDIAPKNILLTGASRGIGLAIARYLLRAGNRVLCVARTREPLDGLRREFPRNAEIFIGDLNDFEVGPRAVAKAVEVFGSLHGLIINHGSVSPIKRLADSDPQEWRAAFDVNFFSAVAFIQPALSVLRQTRGRIIITSSGAAIKAYSTWGAYGSAKAALNHLVQTLAIEEPLITSIAVRPGVVDTEMQAEVRGHGAIMDHGDAERFRMMHLEGRLLRPEQPGDVMARLVLGAGREFSGKFMR